jgi:hypothetical protein
VIAKWLYKAKISIPMEKPEMKTGLYRGLITEVAVRLGRKVPGVHWAIFRQKTPNEAKELFIRLKAEREKKETLFRESLKKVL